MQENMLNHSELIALKLISQNTEIATGYKSFHFKVSIESSFFMRERPQLAHPLTIITFPIFQFTIYIFPRISYHPQLNTFTNDGLNGKTATDVSLSLWTSAEPSGGVKQEEARQLFFFY